ncbi:hypothetical protein Q8A64_06440 [Oxalobacteraceae bacterium R-40]|uniref:Lipoprotein n=1 Tax=Keguizhuia sedimenti TaxID=3064264 RepID=A0ABU1BMJ6_9BURK|nr:hypothetical protein [Oxalobacteraceae bacterium R-40]
MKFFSIPVFAMILSGCAVYPDAPVTAYPSSAVYGSYYGGYPYYDYPYGHYYHPYGYYDRHHHYDGRIPRRDRPSPAPGKDSRNEDERKRELLNRMRRPDDERSERVSPSRRDEDRSGASMRGLLRERSRNR